MKHRMVLIAIALVAIPACTPADDVPPLVSSARAAAPMEPLYPPLSADAVDGEVHEYH